MKRIKKQIVAIGGGGFSESPENLAMERYLIELAGVSEPKVCFLPTASGDSENYLERFYHAFSLLPCRPTHLSLFRRSEHPAELIGQQHIVYVGGGNTANMLAVWAVHGVDKIVRAAHRRGVILAGMSAGANCWFEAGITDSFGMPYRLMPDGLGMLGGLFCPHYASEASRRAVLLRAVRKTGLLAYAVDDDAGLHFIDRAAPKAIRSAPGARAILLARDGARVTETELPIAVDLTAGADGL